MNLIFSILSTDQSRRKARALREANKVFKREPKDDENTILAISEGIFVLLIMGILISYIVEFTGLEIQ